MMPRRSTEVIHRVEDEPAGNRQVVNRLLRGALLHQPTYGSHRALMAGWRVQRDEPRLGLGCVAERMRAVAWAEDERARFQDRRLRCAGHLQSAAGDEEELLFGRLMMRGRAEAGQARDEI